MCGLGVLVHHPSRLRAAATIQAAKIPGGDRVFATHALECTKAFHYCDGVMSHSFKCIRSSRYGSELKLPSHSGAPETLKHDEHYWTASRSRLSYSHL